LQRQHVNPAHNFNNQSRVKKIYFPEENKRLMSKGCLGIVALGTGINSD